MEIDMYTFRKDLRASILCNEYTTMDLNSLVDSYNKELGALLDKHAPTITKTIRQNARGLGGNARGLLSDVIARTNQRTF